jgi:hypothetical protein
MRQARAVMVLLLAAAWPALGAEKLPPLDAEFLEYLASFDSDEEDWALFADDDDATEPSREKKPIAKREARKKEAAAKPAENR